MKKAILIFILFLASKSQAQDFWTQYSTAQTTQGTGVRSISIVDENVTWLNMESGTSTQSSIRRFSKTQDDGLTWISAEIDLGSDSPNLEVANISGTSTSEAYAAVFPKTSNVLGGIWKTIDGGVHWNRQNSADFSDESSYPNLVHFWNQNQGVAMGDPAGGYFEIYTTTNGGENWSRVAISEALIPLAADEYGMRNKYTVTENAIWILTTYNRLLKSSDRGLTWTILSTPIPDFGGAMINNETIDFAFTDQNNGILASEFNLYYTSDGGHSWFEHNWSGDFRDGSISSIPGLPDAYIVIGNDHIFQRGSSYTIDSGITWQTVYDSVPVDGNQVAMLNQYHGFAGGYSESFLVGGIFKWNYLSCICAATTDFESKNPLKAFPNPTEKSLTVTGQNIQKIQVIDVLGKTVMDYSYPQINQTELDMSSLDKGVYWLKVFEQEKPRSLKVIKL